MAAVVIRHETWISEGSTTDLETVLLGAESDADAYQSSDTASLHAVDVYNLPDREVWRVFSTYAANQLGLARRQQPVSSPVSYTLQSASAGNPTYYSTVQMMLRYGATELSQRSVNVDDVMCAPDALAALIRDGVSPTDADENARAWQQLGVINSAIEEASREIDGYLSSITNTPLVTIPARISAVCTRIARYRLARYEEGTEAESRVYRDYKLDIAYLEKLANGELVIDELPPKTVDDDAVASTGHYQVRAPAGFYS